MTQRVELPLPNRILHLHDQRAAHQPARLSMGSDDLARRNRPSGARARVPIGKLRRKIHFPNEASGSLHVGVAGGNVDCSMGLMDLVLASQSPRRAELLRNAGFRFQVRSKPVEEVRRAGEAPRDYAMRLARDKANAAWESREEIVLGADTIVRLGKQVLEKPADQEEARSMLAALSGRIHTVITGICFRHAGGETVDCESTRVWFSRLDSEEI